MLSLSKRLAVISKIVTKDENLGKTALMKYIYLLQQVYKVPIGYDYEIYTYGPYSPEVTGDINLAADFDVIKLTYSSKHTGYEMQKTTQTEYFIAREKDFIDNHGDSISDVIRMFGGKTTKELELSTTIIYLYCTHLYNKRDTSIGEVSKKVRAIKPHFSTEVIETEYRNLESLGILAKAG